MITAAQREKAFRDDLAALLDKHGAQMDITDDKRNYGMHSGIVVITMPAWFENYEVSKEYTEFQL